MPIFCMLVLLLINYPHKYLLVYAKNAINKVLILFYVNSLLSKAIAVAYSISFAKNDWNLLWFNYMNFNEVVARKLNLKKNSKFYIFLLVATSSLILHILMGFILIKTQYIIPTFYMIFLYVAVTILRLYELVVKLQYFIFLYDIQNYFEQLNTLLMDVPQKKLIDRMSYLKMICKTHNELIDLIKLLQIVTTPCILVIIHEDVIRLIGHSYGLVAQFIYDDVLFHYTVSIFNFCNIICEVCLIIYITQHCSKQVI